MNMLANYWGLFVILGLALIEATVAGIANACQQPPSPAKRPLAGPTRSQRRRGSEASWL